MRRGRKNTCSRNIDERTCPSAPGAVVARREPHRGAVLEESDFVSLHCPASPENRHLINAERLKLMKADAFLINTARGDIVDEAALNDALEHRVIAGAGLDVYEREPEVPSGLLKKENVVLLPHLGSATRETRVAMGLKVLENAVAFFSGAEPPNRVV